MRFRSILAAGALFLPHASQAFDDKSFNFEQQAASYHARFDVSQRYISQLDSAISIEEKDNTHLPKHKFTASSKDWDYLLGQTYTIFGLSVATVGLMTFLPESITKWDEEDRDISNLGQKWWDNVSAGPIWDKDEHYLNYIMHPYFGGVYYIAARHAGFNEFESFAYSFMMSTFFWEYGVESFAEIPSIQDVIITPFFGALVGELMYNKEQEIIERGGDVFGSKILGNVSLFFLNPVGHIHYWATDWWKGDSSLTVNYNPWFDNQHAAKFAYDSGANYNQEFIGLQLKLAF